VRPTPTPAAQKTAPVKVTSLTATVAAPLSVDALYHRAAAGLPCWVVDAAGARRALPVDRWMG